MEIRRRSWRMREWWSGEIMNGFKNWERRIRETEQNWLHFSRWASDKSHTEHSKDRQTDWYRQAGTDAPHARMYARSHSHTYTHSHTQTRARVHTHTHTHTHTQVQPQNTQIHTVLRHVEQTRLKAVLCITVKYIRIHKAVVKGPILQPWPDQVSAKRKKGTVKLQIFIRYPFSYFRLETGSYKLNFVLSRASKQNYIEIRWPRDKNKFSSGIKFRTFFKSTKVRN